VNASVSQLSCHLRTWQGRCFTSVFLPAYNFKLSKKTHAENSVSQLSWQSPRIISASLVLKLRILGRLRKKKKYQASMGGANCTAFNSTAWKRKSQQVVRSVQVGSQQRGSINDSKNQAQNEGAVTTVTRLTIVKAEALLENDGGSTPDTFVEIYLDNKLKYTTKVISNTLTAEWNETFTLHHAVLDPEMTHTLADDADTRVDSDTKRHTPTLVDLVFFDNFSGNKKEHKEYLGSVSIALTRTPGSASIFKWYTLSSSSKFSETMGKVSGRVLLEMETHLLASFTGGVVPWEQDEAGAIVPEVALHEVFWWHKGTLQVTVVSGAHMPKMDTFGLCDPLVIVIVDAIKQETKHLRKTLSPVFNESFLFPVADGSNFAQRFFKLRETDSSAAKNIVTVTLQLLDWDRIGNENIGFVSIELHALMDKVARPGAPGIEASFPVLQGLLPTSSHVLGFDGEYTTLTLRFRWELDEVAEAERQRAREAATNEAQQQARAIMLEKEHALNEAIAEDLRVRQTVLRDQFLRQLVTDASLSGDVYSCGAGSYGQHGHGHTEDVCGAPLLVQGAERGVIQAIAAGGAHSLFLLVQQTQHDGEEAGLLSCGAGTFGQLGLIGCQPPAAGAMFEEPEENEAMEVVEQLVPGAVKALADEAAASYGPPAPCWNVRVAEISAGARHSILVTSCGRAFTCGGKPSFHP
jgi:hypothetical protein